MKLRLPSLLATAILATFPSFTASADVIGNGVVYDVGKNHYGIDHSVPGYKEDDMQCWAAAGSNAVQYWQDTYYGDRDTGVTVPNGLTETFPYAPPAGTRYLQVYEKELEYMHSNYGGESYDFFNWWMKGTGIPKNLNAGKEAYYSDCFGNNDAGLAYKGLEEYGDDYPVPFFEGQPVPDFTPENLGRMHQDFTNFIVSTFETQGQIATLDINYGHAITCVGYETNANGLLSALILTNSDDAHFGAFRATIVTELADPLTVDVGMYLSYGERLVLKTDDGEVLHLNATWDDDSPTVKPWVSGAARINTPTGIAREAEQANPTITAGDSLDKNTRILESKTVEGEGIVVGDGVQAMILTSAKTTEGGEAVALSLNGETATNNHTGMTLQEGSMVSLYNLTVENYKNGGIVNGTKMYLHDGEQNISNNTKAGNGAGISNQNYFELQDNESVSIFNNQSTAADGKGGGIFNAEKATVSIHGNQNVTFSGNSAANGNDIYNSANGIVNIADNDAVSFVGDSSKKATDNVAIVNEGELYLAAGEGKQITFDNSTLETTGKTYIGRDKSNWSADTAGAAVFKDATGSVSIKSNSDDSSVYATLENLSVSATAIAGAGDEGGTVSNAMITSLGGLTMNNLKLDTTDSVNTLGKGFTNLDNVVLTLTDNDMVDDDTFDLTSVLTGNLTLDEVVFDLSSTTLTGDALKDITFDLSKAYVDMAHLDLSFKVAQGQVISFVDSGSTVLRATTPLPEPTTGTLSLLALCALAARRRRK